MPLLLICSICHKAVKLETTKTDASGRAVHEECYVQAITNKSPSHSVGTDAPPIGLDGGFQD